MEFEIGEIVTLQSPLHPEYDGMETTILSHFIWLDGKDAYHCSIKSGGEGWYESSLRKKHPPYEEINWVELCNLKQGKEFVGSM